MKPLIPPPALGLLFGLAMWALARSSAPDFAFAFPGQLWAALAVGGAGLAIDLVCVAAFFKRKTTVNPLAPAKAKALVTDGLYRISRNPMYLGMLLILFGWGVWLGSSLNIALIALFVWAITELQIKPEERALRDKFGQAYDDYCARVRRWI